MPTILETNRFLSFPLTKPCGKHLFKFHYLSFNKLFHIFQRKKISMAEIQKNGENDKIKGFLKTIPIVKK